MAVAERQAAMIAYVLKDWFWMIAFFPLWIVTAILCFAVVSVPKRAAGRRTQKFLDASALVLSVSSAAAVLIGLDCASYISLPFAKPACYMLNSNGPVFDLSQAAQRASDIFN